VKSRKIPVAVTEIELPYITLHGITSRVRRRSVVYDYVLSEDEKKVLQEVRKSLGNSRVPIEVFDIGKAGLLARLFRRILESLLERPSLTLQKVLPRSTSGLVQTGQMSPHQHS